jgi:hypothetical protein
LVELLTIIVQSWLLIADHHCSKLVTHFPITGGIVDHYCSKLVTHFANIGWFFYHHCSKLVTHFAITGWIVGPSFFKDGYSFC